MTDIIIDRTLEIEAWCSDCNKKLFIDSAAASGDTLIIHVSPCNECLEAAKQGAYILEKTNE